MICLLGEQERLHFVFTAELEVRYIYGMNSNMLQYSASLHTGSRGESVSNGRGEEGLFWGGGVVAGVE